MWAHTFGLLFGSNHGTGTCRWGRGLNCIFFKEKMCFMWPSWMRTQRWWNIYSTRVQISMSDVLAISCVRKTRKPHERTHWIMNGWIFPLRRITTGNFFFSNWLKRTRFWRIFEWRFHPIWVKAFFQITQFTSLFIRFCKSCFSYVYWGEYPLSFAACLGQEECYRLMLARGANPNNQDTNGNTVLHMLVIHNKLVSSWNLIIGNHLK